MTPREEFFRSIISVTEPDTFPELCRLLLKWLWRAKKEKNLHLPLIHFKETLLSQIPDSVFFIEECSSFSILLLFFHFDEERVEMLCQKMMQSQFNEEIDLTKLTQFRSSFSLFSDPSLSIICMEQRWKITDDHLSLKQIKKMLFSAEQILRSRLVGQCYPLSSHPTGFSKEIASSPALDQREFFFLKLLKEKGKHVALSHQLFQATTFISHAPKNFIAENALSHLIWITLAYYKIKQQLQKEKKKNVLIESPDMEHEQTKDHSLCVVVGMNHFLTSTVILQTQLNRFVQQFFPSISLHISSHFAQCIEKQRYVYCYIEFEKKEKKTLSIKEKHDIHQKLKPFLINQIIPSLPPVKSITIPSRLTKSIQELNRELKKKRDCLHIDFFLEKIEENTVTFYIVAIQYKTQRSLLDSLTNLNKQGKIKTTWPISSSLLDSPGKEGYCCLFSFNYTPFLSENGSLVMQKATLFLHTILSDVLGKVHYNCSKTLLDHEKKWLNFQKGITRDLKKNPFFSDLSHDLFHSLTPSYARDLLTAFHFTTLFSLCTRLQPIDLEEVADVQIMEQSEGDYLIIALASHDHSIDAYLSQRIHAFGKNQHTILKTDCRYNNKLFIGYFVPLTIERRHHFFFHFQKWTEAWKTARQREQLLNIGMENCFFEKESINAIDPFASFLSRSLHCCCDNDHTIIGSIIPSIDYTQYFCILKKNRQWADGSEILACHLVDAWRKWVQCHLPFSFLFSPIQQMDRMKKDTLNINHATLKALNDHTIYIQLAFPSRLFPHRFRTFPFALWKKPFYHFYRDSYQQPLSSLKEGAFHFSHGSQPDHWIFLRNEQNHNTAIRECHFFSSPSSSNLMDQFSKKKIHWLGAPFSPLSLSTLSQLKERRLLQQKGIGYSFVLLFNTSVFPFHSPLLRKALSIAINRTTMMKTVLSHFFPPALSPISFSSLCNYPFFPDGETELAQHLFQKALKEMKIPPKKFPQVEITVLNWDWHKKIVLEVCKTWNALFPITTTPVFLSAKEWEKQKKEKAFTVTTELLSQWNNNPLLVLEQFQEISSQSYQKILQQIHMSTNVKQTTELYLSATKLLMKQMPFSPLFFIPNYYAKADEVFHCDECPLSFCFTKAAIGSKKEVESPVPVSPSHSRQYTR